MRTVESEVIASGCRGSPVAVDALLINIAFLIAYWVRYDLQWLRSVDPANNVPYTAYLPMVFLLTLILLLARREGAYLRRTRPFFDEFYGILNATTTAIMLVVFCLLLPPPLLFATHLHLCGSAHSALVGRPVWCAG